MQPPLAPESRPQTTRPSAATKRVAPPVAGNVVRRMLGTAIRIAIGFFSVPIFMRLIGASQWGLLMLFQAAAAPLALLDLGIGPAMIKRTAEALGREDEEAVARTLRAALSFSLVVLAGGVLLILLLSGWFARSAFAIPPGDVETAIRGFRVVALSWAAGVVLTFSTNVLVAHQRYGEVLRVGMLGMVLTTGAGLGAAALRQDAAVVLLAQTAASFVVAGFGSTRAALLLPKLRIRLGWDPAELRRLLRFGGWYTVANTGVVLATWSDRYILGAFFTPRIVGFYSIPQQMQQLMTSLFSEGADVLLPAVSLRQGMGEAAAARRLALVAGWVLTSAFGPFAVTVGVVGGDFIRLWISPIAAQEASGVLRLLCATSIVGLAAVAPVFYALGTGHSYWQAPFSLTSGVASLVVGIALVPRLGINGVGVGLLTGAIVRWALFVPLWRMLFRSGVSAREFLVHVCAPPLLSLLLLIAAGRVHDAIPHVPGWVALTVEGVTLLAAVAGAQFIVGELLPGGRGRRRDVVESFRPVVARAWSLFRGAEPR